MKPSTRARRTCACGKVFYLPLTGSKFIRSRCDQCNKEYGEKVSEDIARNRSRFVPGAKLSTIEEGRREREELDRMQSMKPGLGIIAALKVIESWGRD